MLINETTMEDRDRLAEWIAADNSKKHAEPESWYTGKGLMSFKYEDTKGPVCYIRLDKEGDLATNGTPPPPSNGSTILPGLLC